MSDVKNETVSAERLAMLLEGARLDTEMQTSTRYKREAQEMVTILSELLALRQPTDTSDGGGEVEGSDAAAIEIADAVISWMVKYDLLDADQEYRDDDIIAVLDDLSPGLATTNDEAFATPLFTSPAPLPVGVTQHMVDRTTGHLFNSLGLSRWGLRLEDVEKVAREVLEAALSKPGEQG
jgi:hypothetical protein